MMEELFIELKKIEEQVLKLRNTKLTSEKAFVYLVLQRFYFNTTSLEKIVFELEDCITDGSNDGGIDFVFYDEELDKITLGQCKFTEANADTDIINELSKIDRTYDDFMNFNNGHYNSVLKKVLREAIDRHPENSDIEYAYFTIGKINTQTLNKKINNDASNLSKEIVGIYDYDEILSKIESINNNIQTVKEEKLKLDEPNNFLQYESENTRGIMVNVSSNSISSLYDKYKDKGLFDLNIRKYIKNKLVDDGIISTLDKDRENFWFLNNGIIIACDEYRVDGNTVKLYEFSIVNGGQTTSLIGRYRGENKKEFFLPCKIISSREDKNKDSHEEFFNKIAEATNSQKPIKLSDLKSNSPEMRKLRNWLEDEKIDLQIKRGETRKKNLAINIKNEELGQLILSFIYQKPGTARSGKKSLFENAKIYAAIYKQNYHKEKNKKDFIVDLIRLNVVYNEMIEKLLKDVRLDKMEKNILKNAKYIIFALFGAIYRIENKYITVNEIIEDQEVLKNLQFNYHSFITNYKDDDFYEKLEDLIYNLTVTLTEEYKSQDEAGKITSISNLFKTDKKYLDDILTKVLKSTLVSKNKKEMYQEFFEIFHK